jgi:hypothetical protein
MATWLAGGEELEAHRDVGDGKRMSNQEKRCQEGCDCNKLPMREIGGGQRTK